IRDLIVTGVQTCALPIWPLMIIPSISTDVPAAPDPWTEKYVCCIACEPPTSGAVSVTPTISWPTDWIVCADGTESSTSRGSTCEIGRASCRERAEKAREE